MSGVLSACVETHPDSHDGGGLQLGKDAFGCAEALLRAIDSRCVRVVPLFGDHTSDRMHDCVSLPCRALSFQSMHVPTCVSASGTAVMEKASAFLLSRGTALSTWRCLHVFGGLSAYDETHSDSH